MFMFIPWKQEGDNRMQRMFFVCCGDCCFCELLQCFLGYFHIFPVNFVEFHSLEERLAAEEGQGLKQT